MAVILARARAQRWGLYYLIPFSPTSQHHLATAESCYEVGFKSYVCVKWGVGE